MRDRVRSIPRFGGGKGDDGLPRPQTTGALLHASRVSGARYRPEPMLIVSLLVRGGRVHVHALRLSASRPGVHAGRLHCGRVHPAGPCPQQRVDRRRGAAARRYRCGARRRGRPPAHCRPLPRVLLREGRGLLLSQPRLPDQARAVHYRGARLDHAGGRIPEMAQGAECRTGAADRAGKLRTIRRVVHGELAAIVIILLCAAIMARGGWV